MVTRLTGTQLAVESHYEYFEKGLLLSLPAFMTGSTWWATEPPLPQGPGR